MHTKCKGKPEEKIPPGRPECRWKDKTKRDLKETGCEDVDWIHLSLYWVKWRSVVDIMNLPVP
jgi:hypothetical protein